MVLAMATPSTLKETPGCAVYSLSGVSDPTPRIVTMVSYPPLLVTVVPGTRPLSPARPIAFDLSSSVLAIAVTATGAFCKSTGNFSAVTVTSSSTAATELSAGRCACSPTAARVTQSTDRHINKLIWIDLANCDMTTLPPEKRVSTDLAASQVQPCAQTPEPSLRS